MNKDEKLLISGTGKVEDTEDGKLKVVFEPGCFDHIDVENQEELDAIMAEITTMFENMTPEELKAGSRELTDEDIEAMDPEERDALLQALDQSITGERKNRLQ